MDISKKVIEQITKVLKKNGIEGEISESTELLRTYSIDSLIAIEILVSMEEIFNIEIKDEDLSFDLLETPKVLIDYICQICENK